MTSKPTWQQTEVAKCYRDAFYFITQYIKIQDPIAGEWIPFDLWDDQKTALETMIDNRLVVILKARQLGLTWLVLAYFLWRMLFRPEAVILLFSRRDKEAIHLLDDRLKGMYKHLPNWLKLGQIVLEDNAHEWQLSNGSVARAFPTSAGDSYSATAALVDEADLVVDLNRLMRAVKPTIDAGGQMILLSRTDKQKPARVYTAIYSAANKKPNDWACLFLPWFSRTDRDDEWYEKQKRDIISRTGGLDDLHEQYPATDTEALSPSTLDKRIPHEWLERCYIETRPILLDDIAEKGASIAQLEVYELPIPGRPYFIGADPAEGHPTSDDSALEVIDALTGREVAALAGKLSPPLFAAVVAHVARLYNNAHTLVERNNHGHAVLLWLSDNAQDVPLLNGLDGRPGWLTSSLSKVSMWDTTAEMFRHGEAAVRAFETYLQISSIDIKTLRAPDGEMDDRAVAFALAQCARLVPRFETSVQYQPVRIGEW